MGTSCRDILDVIPETVVLAFDVAGWTDPKDAERIARSKEIAKAINEELASQGKQLVEKHFAGKTITQEDALKMLSDAGSEKGARVPCRYLRPFFSVIGVCVRGLQSEARSASSVFLAVV